MDTKDDKRPTHRTPPGQGFQKMIDAGALERVKPSTLDESTYKLNVSGIDFLKPPRADKPAEPETPEAKPKPPA